MKLYASTVCVGLIFIFVCPKAEEPLAVSDFCKIAGADIAGLQKLSDAELAALDRPRKEAIASLRRSFKRECAAPAKPVNPTPNPTETP